MQALQHLLPLLPLLHIRHRDVPVTQTYHVQILRDELVLGRPHLELEASLPHLQTGKLAHQNICGSVERSVSQLLEARALVLLPDELHAGLGADVDLIAVRTSSGSGCFAPLSGLESL